MRGSTSRPPEEAIHRAESAVAQGDWARGWGPSLIALFTARRGLLPGRRTSRGPRTTDGGSREIRIAALECYAAVALGVGGQNSPQVSASRENSSRSRHTANADTHC